MPSEAAAFLAKHLVAGGREGNFTNPLCFCSMNVFRVSAVSALVLSGHGLAGNVDRQRGVRI